MILLGKWSPSKSLLFCGSFLEGETVNAKVVGDLIDGFAEELQDEEHGGDHLPPNDIEHWLLQSHHLAACHEDCRDDDRQDLYVEGQEGHLHERRGTLVTEEMMTLQVTRAKMRPKLKSSRAT